MIRIVLLFCLFSLSACTSIGGAKGTPYDGLADLTANAGHVYIYRPSRFIMSLAIPTLTVNGEKSVGVRNGSYMIYELPEGVHTFALSNNGNWAAGNIEFEVDLKSNSRQFYRLTAGLEDMAAYGQFVMITLNGHLTQVAEEFAVNEMASLKFTSLWQP